MATRRQFRTLVRVGWLLAAAAGAAGAQSGAAADTGRSASCADSVEMNARDTVNVYVVARLRAFDPDQAVPRAILDLALYEIASRFRSPSPLALRSYSGEDRPGGSRGSPTHGHLAVNAMYGLALARDGRVADARVLTSSLNPELDQHVLDAIRAADSAGMMPLLPESVHGKSAELRLRLTTEGRQPRDSAMTLFRLRTPRVEFSEMVQPLRSEPPRYPSTLRSANAGGEVLVQLVVGPDGGVELPSVNILRATHIHFVQAVLEVLPRYRFRPARVAGCPVAMLAQLPFEFRITR